MKKIFSVLSLGCVLICLNGCTPLQQIIQPIHQLKQPAQGQPLSSYSGPKARVTVPDFEVRFPKTTGDIGTGLRDMFITVLVNSNRFSVVEHDALEAVKQSQELFVAGAEDKQPAQKDKIKAADLIATVAVVEFQPQASGGRAGVGGGGGVGRGVLGASVGTSLNKARITLDVRLIDVSSLEVLVASRIQGQASDIGDAITSAFLGTRLSGGLSVYANTPMEKAIRICIIEAVRYISNNLSADYFKY